MNQVRIVVFRMFAILWGFSLVAAAAAESERKSVEELARSARNSVVVVMHQGRGGSQEGLGSGFVVSEEGLIATSLHVIGEARPIVVQLANQRDYEATEIFAWDRKLDLAIVRIKAENLSALPLGDSDDLEQGASVVAMGNPLGLAHSIVQGVVSARRDFDGVEMIQLAIPIEEGNSGGPVLDRHGRVQGVLAMKSVLSANLGFAMPVNALKSLLDRPNPISMDRWLRIGALNTKEWKPVMGARWSQKGGRIEVEGLGAGFGGRSICISAREVPEPPYEVAVSVRLDDEAGAAGLVFESDGGEKHYGFYPSAGQLRLTRFDGPNVFSWNILKQLPSPHYRAGEWNHLKVRVEKERIQCFVNERLTIESDDPVLRQGTVGLAKFRQTKASFKNFSVGKNVSATPFTPSAELQVAVDELTKATEPAAATELLLGRLDGQTEAGRLLLLSKAQALEKQAQRVRELAAAVHHHSMHTALSELFDEPDEKVDLFRAALLVSKLDNPDLEIEPYQRQIESMAEDLIRGLPAGADDRAKLQHLIRFLFVENGFHGSRSDYYNRANSYMNDVIDDREGLPITLSVLFLELANRIDLRCVHGAPLPKHFMVRFSPPESDDQWIDVFENGKIMTRSEVNDLLLEMTGAPLSPGLMKPAGKREIIVRILHNLLNVARDNEPGAALRYLDLIVALSPNSTADRLNRAMVRARLGNRAGAREDLKWILNNEPSDIDLDRVREFYQTLQ